MAKDWREDGKRRLKEKQAKGRFKLAEGDNCIRILPNKKDSSEQKFPPFIEYKVHNDVGPDKKFVRCGKNFRTGEGDCWICDTLTPKLAGSKDKGKRIMAEAMVPRDSFAVQVAVVDGDSGKFSGPYAWYPSAGGRRALSTKLLAVISSTKRDYVDAVKGYNLNIDRTGTGKNDTVYGAIIPDEEASKVPSSILAASKPFKELIPQYSEETQKSAWYGKSEEEEPEEEEEDTRRKKPADEDEEEVDEDAAPDPDAEEEEAESEEDEDAPKPKKKKKPVDEEEESTEEEEPAEEDEDEPKPKKKNRVVEDEEEAPAEEDEDTPPEDEEEDEPKPKKKKVVEDEEEEPTEEEEEEESPKPKKKKHAEEEEEPEEEPEEEEEPRPKKKLKKGKR